MTINPELLEVQKVAFKYLLDTKTREVLYGGGAAGGKTYLGCMWVISSAIKYHQTRWLIGRAVLKYLKETTMVTLFDIMDKWGLIKDVHYEFNTKDNYIKFKPVYGSSVILLKDLFFYPSDPEYIGLGSLEVTGVFIDEAGEVDIKAKEILTVRVRYKLKDFCLCGYLTAKSKIIGYNEKRQPNKWLCGGCGEETMGLLPKSLYSCNPAKNWTYQQFYRPWSQGTLDEGRMFIPALASDNKFNSEFYIESMKRLNPLDRKRLYEGEWDYGDEDYALMDFDAILNLFINDVETGDYFITCDWAGLGKDKCVIWAWEGFRAIEYTVYDKSDDKMIRREIERLQNKYMIRTNRIVIDEMGGGQGIVNAIGCEGFVASHTPVFVAGSRENYKNFKTQCFYKFADFVNKRLIRIDMDDPKIKQTIVEELEQIRRPEKGVDDGTKLTIEGKDEIRSRIGRSPDFADSLSMRMYFVLKKHRKFLI